MRLLVDENFHGAIVRGLLRRRPQLDIVRVYDVGLGEAEDPDILEWAAAQGRLVLTHDAATLISFAYERVTAGKVMPGIIEVRQSESIGVVIEDLLLLVEASEEGEWEGHMVYLPLR
jgi:predicted nuclease of predicted toxin-antitoxin system